MDEFLLVFRRDFLTKEEQPSPEEMQDHLKNWKKWYDILRENDRLARPLQRWDGEGKILTKNKTLLNGPYAEIKESIGGLVIIKAVNYDDAVKVAKGCPIFDMGGNVEIRKGF